MMNEGDKGKTSGGFHNNGQVGRSSGFNRDSDNIVRELPKEYIELLKEGYFDNCGVIKEQYLIGLAENVAISISGGKFSRKPMTATQMCSFFGHVRGAEMSYGYATQDIKKEEKSGKITTQEVKEKEQASGRQLVNQIKKLDMLVKNAASNIESSITPEFIQFISRNAVCCNSPRDILNGFIPHFEAIMGFFKYYERNKNNRNQ